MMSIILLIKNPRISWKQTEQITSNPAQISQAPITDSQWSFSPKIITPAVYPITLSKDWIIDCCEILQKKKIHLRNIVVSFGKKKKNFVFGLEKPY